MNHLLEFIFLRTAVCDCALLIQLGFLCEEGLCERADMALYACGSKM